MAGEPVAIGQTLTVQYPHSYDDAISVESGKQRLLLRAVGATPAFATEAAGKLVYERPYPFTDTIEVPGQAHSEELLLLHDARAPHVYEWEIVETEGISSVVLDGGAIRFLSDAINATSRHASGGFSHVAGSLQIDRPWVIDATGKRDESAAQWTLVGEGPMPTAIRLTLTNDRLAYPLVIDPSFSVTGSLLEYRYGNAATLLPNGKVLVAAGYGGPTSTWLASAELYDPATGTFTATGSLATARVDAASALLPNGKVLIAGGQNASGWLASAELYDPTTGTFSPTGNMPFGTDSQTATLLQTGKVLLVNGPSALLYDPAAGTFSSTGSLVNTHYDHTATLLPNGKVLIAGGYYFATLATAELYDPASGTFASTGNLGAARISHTSTLLANGKVLVAGGQQLTETGSTPLGSAELYDPALGTFSPTGNLTTVRRYHSSTLLPSGKVLLASGSDAAVDVPSAELYDPAAGTFAATGSMAVGRGRHSATLLANGRVVVIGGTAITNELYDADSGTFSATGSLAAARERHTATMLPNGKVLIAGGTSGGSPLGTAQLYDPTAGTFTSTGTLMHARFAHTATLLATGKVLLVGGYDPSDVAAAELYDPVTGTFSLTGSLSMSEHTATLLPSGKVLVRAGTVASLYDPATGTFSSTGAPGQERRQHTATLLANGKVLISGGYGPPTYDFMTSAELYDPLAGTFSPTTGNMVTARRHLTTLLPNGKVFIVGEGAAAELYDPISSTFSATANLLVDRDGGASATLLRNGKVLVAGGYYSTTKLADAELYDPPAGTFSTTGNLNIGRNGQTATLLPNGKVLMVGGRVAGDVLTASAELYDVGQGFSDSRRPIVGGAPTTQAQPGTMTLTGTQFRGDSEASSGESNSSASNVPLLYLQRIDNDQTLFVGPSTSWSDTSFTSSTLSGLPAGYYRVTIVTNGIPSLQRMVSFANPGPPPQISINDVTVTEGNAGTTLATFTVSLSAPGGPVTVNYATANGTAVAATTASNPASIAIPIGGNATPYPSGVNVSSVSGTITKITATLTGYSHSYAQDVDILLVGPGGQSVVLMSDAGSSSNLTGVNITFDDAAAGFLPSGSFASGTYRPTNISDGEGADAYPAPAPASGYGSALSAFNATSPNGTWNLYVVDDFSGDGGSISGGWSLTITTVNDYVASSGTVSFPMGTTTQTISVPVVGDTSLETNETFFVNLSGATNATILDAQGQGTITNDDTTPDAPANVVAAATSATAVNITWSAAPAVSSYRVYRGQRSGGVITYSLVGSPGTTSFNDTTASAAMAYLYKVHSFAGIESVDSNLDLATTVVFTDPVITSNVTTAKLAHFTELLTAVNAVRTLAGLSPAAFTAPAPATNVTIRRQHLLDLRTALDAARSTLTLGAIPYAEPSITAGSTKIKATHVTELRSGVN